ncbi:MAG TPA: response regulator transcription factor [Sulfurimonas sp.]|nr:response regulator transcription factor [Sulfurimonas sp.]
MKILLVEDDKTLGESICDLLESEDYKVQWAQDGEAALDATRVSGFDLLLLDVNVPFINGFELLKSLRESGDETPAIFITALVDIASLKKGFEVGADDYLRKPFDPTELLVRISVAIEKSFASHSKEVRLGNLCLNLQTERFYLLDKELSLTPYEQIILTLLIKEDGRIVPKEELLYALSRDEEASESALRVHMSKLKKMGIELENIRAKGYRLNAF